MPSVEELTDPVELSFEEASAALAGIQRCYVEMRLPGVGVVTCFGGSSRIDTYDVIADGTESREMALRSAAWTITIPKSTYRRGTAWLDHRDVTIETDSFAIDVSAQV